MVDLPAADPQSLIVYTLSPVSMCSSTLSHPAISILRDTFGLPGFLHNPIGRPAVPEGLYLTNRYLGRANIGWSSVSASTRKNPEVSQSKFQVIDPSICSIPGNPIRC
jgi:hypothetical protein